MKKNKSDRSPVLGLVFVVVATVLVFPEHFGFVGRHVSESFYLVGGLGRFMGAFVFYFAGLVHVVPAGAAKLGERAARRFVERRRVARRGEAARRLLSEALRPVRPVVDVVPGVAEEPGRLDEVRAAMKDLGYTKREYEGAVARMDASRPLEALIREGILVMQVRRDVS